MRYVAALVKPILTVIVTVLVGAFLLSVISPTADGLIGNYIGAWAFLDGAIEQSRTWLGMEA